MPTVRRVESTPTVLTLVPAPILAKTTARQHALSKIQFQQRMHPCTPQNAARQLHQSDPTLLKTMAAPKIVSTCRFVTEFVLLLGRKKKSEGCLKQTAGVLQLAALLLSQNSKVGTASTVQDFCILLRFPLMRQQQTSTGSTQTTLMKVVIEKPST